jgi:hypothetical protein
MTRVADQCPGYCVDSARAWLTETGRTSVTLHSNEPRIYLGYVYTLIIMWICSIELSLSHVYVVFITTLSQSYNRPTSPAYEHVYMYYRTLHVYGSIYKTTEAHKDKEIGGLGVRICNYKM